MTKEVKWVLATVVVVGLIALAMWYSTNMAGGNQEAATAAANTPSIANAVQQVSAQITAAASAKNTAKLVATVPAYQAVVQSLANLATRFSGALNVAQNKGTDVSAARAAYTEMMIKLSYLQSSTPSFANASALVANFSVVLGDIATINTTLQAAGNK